MTTQLDNAELVLVRGRLAALSARASAQRVQILGLTDENKAITQDADHLTAFLEKVVRRNAELEHLNASLEQDKRASADRERTNLERIAELERRIERMSKVTP